ncbi:LysM domain-containing protein [Streptococcus sp. sy004]|uniref:LysM peptidoglycan-binding domain-containing protein n=1 Tax=Streptococcus sp. sy004 TaxID=2600149 RepID=UPI0011B5AA8E|nr:LysM domain-containing protein [Streptococcus sp. sy004]TWT09855.1 LysM peptidoglycan-binding domain-containing protein [Streptococcus sp. sy004]
MSKNFIKKSLLLSTMALSIFGVNQVQAEEGLVWAPRSVEEIRADLVKENNKITYTVQYGDTLGSIAEAVGLEVNVLANLNNIADVNFILPNTVLTITYGDNQDVKTVQVDVPQTSSTEEMTVKADLATNEVVLKNQTVKVNDLTAEPASQVAQIAEVVNVITSSQEATPVATTPVVESSVEQVKEPVVPSSKTVVTEVVSEASASSDIAENTSVATTEMVSEEPVSSSSEVASETHESSVAVENVATETVEEVSTETSTSDVVETPNVEEVTQSIVESSEMTQNYGQSEDPITEAVTQVVEASTEEVAPVEETSAAEEATAVEQPVVETPAEPVETVVEEVAPESTPTQTLTYNSAGMQAQTAAFQSQVGNEFGISNIGGYRNSNDDHGQGLAVDIMVDSAAQGDQVAQYAVDNIANNDIAYVIWQQRFYSPVNNIYGPANTWNLMPDRGSATQNHMDHVHVSMNE